MLESRQSVKFAASDIELIQMNITLMTTSKNLLRIVIITFVLFFISACSKDPVVPDLPPVQKSIPKIDDDINSFMERFMIPGLSLAVTKNGKLVYAKGYGYADKVSLAKVDTTHLFRIASLSKFITSIGIMQLIEEGKLSMDDKVFGEGSVLGNDFGTSPYKEHVTDIRIRDLLHHECGGWSNSGSDPAFTQSSLSVNQLISWAMDNRLLDNEPGTKFSYSNLGYQILGRVIEKKSGKTYVNYTEEKVLTPSGVKNMQMGESSLAERKPNEVRYYGQGGENPYGSATGVIARLNSAGGWIASSIDLMRIMTHIDGFNSGPDILSSSAIQTMTTPSSISNYACGFYVNARNNWWHSGSLNGTRTWIVRSQSGYCWAILMNSRSTSSEFTTALDKLIWPAVNDASTKWPDIDLF